MLTTTETKRLDSLHGDPKLFIADDFNTLPDSVRNLISQFFLDEAKVARYQNPIIHEGGKMKNILFFSQRRYGVEDERRWVTNGASSPRDVVLWATAEKN